MRINLNRIMAATLVGFTGMALSAAPPETSLLLPAWDAIYALRSGFGYKDNVHLSHAEPQSSPFVTAGAEILVLRLADQGPQFHWFTSADANCYFEVNRSRQEYVAFSRAQLEQATSDTLKLSLAGDCFFQDQFLDVSVTETNRQAVAVRGQTIAVKPGLRLDLPGRSWFAIEAQAARQFYRDPLDDYWEIGPKLTLGKTYGHDSRLSLGSDTLWRFHDDDPARTAAGAVIPGSQRRRFQQDARLTWRHHWDESQRWRTVTSLGGRLAAENGGGYADYRRWSAAAEVQYRRGRWEFTSGVRSASYQYINQDVSPSDASKRRRTDWAATFRLERQLTKQLKFMASYEHENTLSNDELETYTVNTVSGAVQWEF